MFPIAALLGCASPPPSPVPEPPPAAEPVAEPAPPPAPDPGPLLDAPPVALDVTIDATAPATGKLGIELVWRGLRARSVVLTRLGSGTDADWGPLTLTDGQGAPVRFDGDDRRFRIRGEIPDTLIARYDVTPGKDGRHGHQGLVTTDFATFDGRVLLQLRGEPPLGEVRFRYRLPEGWVVANALRPTDDGWWHLDADADDARRYWLGGMCVGLGPFERVDTALGATEVRSFVHRDLPDAVKQRIQRETASWFRTFHDRLGFDPGYPMAFVRTPTVDKMPIFGGSSSRGSCYEAVKPGMPELNSRLLGHRFAHPFDRYPPSGLVFQDRRDAWFEEGWAGWAEVVIGQEAGIYEESFWLGRLFQQHLDTRRRHPDWPVPLSEDEEVEDADQREYVHYTEAPLAVRLLDHLIRERGGTDLAAVSRAMWARHGHHAGAVDLRAEVDEFGKASYADFWAAIADGEPWFAPTWSGFVDDATRARAAAPPVARSGDVPLSADWLYWLASRPEFGDWRDLLAFAASEGPRRERLRQRGVSLAHPEVLGAVNGLGPLARWELVQAERRWPLHLVAPDGPLPVPPVRFVDGHPDAAVLRELLAAEARYDAARGRSAGVDRIELRIGSKEEATDRPPVLAVPKGERMQVAVRTVRQPPVLELQLLVGGEVRETRTVVTDPREDEVSFGFHPPDRPTEAGVLVVRAGPPGGPYVERAFWQR